MMSSNYPMPRNLIISDSNSRNGLPKRLTSTWATKNNSNFSMRALSIKTHPVLPFLAKKKVIFCMTGDHKPPSRNPWRMPSLSSRILLYQKGILAFQVVSTYFNIYLCMYLTRMMFLEEMTNCLSVWEIFLQWNCSENPWKLSYIR